MIDDPGNPANPFVAPSRPGGDNEGARGARGLQTNPSSRPGDMLIADLLVVPGALDGLEEDSQIEGDFVPEEVMS